jgi:hypothetical protein
VDEAWQILTPLTIDETSALERGVDAAIDAFLTEHPETTDTYGEVSAVDGVPSADELQAEYTEAGAKLAKATLDKLKRCQSSIFIESPGDLDEDPLQVAILRWLVERAGDCLVSLGAPPYLTLAQLEKRLAKLPLAEDFDAIAAEALSADEDDRPRTGRKTLSRAERILAVLEAAEDNADLKLDLRAAIGRAPERVRQYGLTLVERGPVDDARAAKELGLSAAELEPIAAALDALVERVKPR